MDNMELVVKPIGIFHGYERVGCKYCMVW